jgi:predicted permease
MRFLHSLRFRFATLFHRSQTNVEMEEELRSHIQHRADDLERSGLGRAEAERRARIEFGGYEKFKEECRETVGVYFLETLLQDLRLALHRLGKSPGFTAAAVGTLALAIGANAVVFGALNALILRPLNVPRADSLYQLERASDKWLESYPNYLDLRDRNRSFNDLAAFNITPATLDAGDNRSNVWVFEVSGNYFEALGIQPYLGRLFHASDEHGSNSAPYAVLTYAYWHSQFQNDRGVLGRTVQLNKHPYTIIGVAAPGFHGTLLFFSQDLFVPMVNEAQIDASFLNARGNRTVAPIGHLKAGVTPAQATADLNSIGSYLEKTYPKDDVKMTFRLARPGLLGDYFGDPVKGFLAGLMLLAGLILLAACVNLGSLFAARAADRSREIAVRLALGAGRLRILRHLFTESVLISLAGGAVGLWGSIMLLGWLSTWQPIPRYAFHMPVSPDAKVYLVALLLALASGFLFGSVPVRQVFRTNPCEVIKAGPAASVGRRITARDLLLGAQIAICAVLVTASLVAVRGLLRSLDADFGFEPRNVMLADADLPIAAYRGEAVPAMQKRLIDAMKMIPGVTSVGLIDTPPLVNGGGNGDSNVFVDQTTDLRPSRAAAHATVLLISPGYFHAAGTALLSGRTFTWHDDKNAPRVAVVNQEFARKVFGSARNPVGRYYKMPDGTRIQVVGIAEDGKYSSLTEAPSPAMFLPLLQSPSGGMWLVVRSSRNPKQLAAAIRSKLRDLGVTLPAFMQTWNRALDIVLFPARMATVTLGVLGLIAAILAVTGIFGLAAFSVSKRKKDLGIRIALGAQRREVLEAALGRALKLLAFGSGAGLLLGILASRVLAAIVYQATPRDPVVLAGVVLAMLSLGLVATWIPARRALSIDPVTLLREE